MSEFQFTFPPGNLMFYGPGGKPAMTIRFDRDPVCIEVAEGISVDEAAAASWQHSSNTSTRSSSAGSRQWTRRGWMSR